MKKGALAIIPILLAASILFGCTSGCGSKNGAISTGPDVSTTGNHELQESPATGKTDDALATEPTTTATKATQGVVAAKKAESKEVAGQEAKKEEVAAITKPRERLATPEKATAGQKGPAAAKKEPTGKPTVADTSQQFLVDSFPGVVMIDRNTIEQHAAKRDPRLGYLKITGLKVAEDGKTVQFDVENTFCRSNAQPIHVGEVMLSGLVRFDYDDGAAQHHCVLFKEKRVEIKEGSNPFKTNPEVYPHVTKIEGVQFFFTPAELSKPSPKAAGHVADTSQQFLVDSLPDVITIDQNTIEQHAEKRDPRLGYLRITQLGLSEDGRALKFCIENTFDRSNAEPIHVPGLMVNGIGRFDYDGGATLRSCILFKDKRMTFEKGSKLFETDPKDYPHLTKIEGFQFFFTP